MAANSMYRRAKAMPPIDHYRSGNKAFRLVLSGKSHNNSHCKTSALRKKKDCRYVQVLRKAGLDEHDFHLVNGRIQKTSLLKVTFLPPIATCLPYLHRRLL